MRSRRLPPPKNACWSEVIASRFVLRGGAAGLLSRVVGVLARALVALACRVFFCVLGVFVVFACRLLAFACLALACLRPSFALFGVALVALFVAFVPSLFLARLAACCLAFWAFFRWLRPSPFRRLASLRRVPFVCCFGCWLFVFGGSSPAPFGR